MFGRQFLAGCREENGRINGALVARRARRLQPNARKGQRIRQANLEPGKPFAREEGSDTAQVVIGRAACTLAGHGIGSGLAGKSRPPSIELIGPQSGKTYSLDFAHPLLVRSVVTGKLLRTASNF